MRQRRQRRTAGMDDFAQRFQPIAYRPTQMAERLLEYVVLLRRDLHRSG